jgi:hypothetical protein
LGSYVGGDRSGNLIAGNRHYELTNHLGNVMAVLTDRKLPVIDNGTVSFKADVLRQTDYYAFGATSPRLMESGQIRYSNFFIIHIYPTIK